MCVCPRLLWIQSVGVLGNGYSYSYWLDLKKTDWRLDEFPSEEEEGKEAT